VKSFEREKKKQDQGILLEKERLGKGERIFYEEEKPLQFVRRGTKKENLEGSVNIYKLSKRGRLKKKKASGKKGEETIVCKKKKGHFLEEKQKKKGKTKQGKKENNGEGRKNTKGWKRKKINRESNSGAENLGKKKDF